MPNYMYEADAGGKFVKGTLKAPSLQVANLKLKSRNLIPVYVAEKPIIPFFGGGQSVKTRDVLIFTRQLAFLLSSGVSLLRALNISYTMTEDVIFKRHIRDILHSVESGDSFSAALRKKPSVFKGFYVNMVVCSEETGQLDETLRDLMVYIEKSESIKSKVKSAMMYPVVVLGISLCIISGIIMFVVPRFEALYGSVGSELPALTQLFVSISHLMRESWYIIIGAAVLGIMGFIQYSKTESGKDVVSGVVSALPLFGKLQFQGGLARFCRSFFSLSKAGVNLLEALNIAANISDHKAIRTGIDTVQAAVSQGKGFAYGLSQSRVFPNLVVNMVKVGEESGRLETSFEKLTLYYEEELENMIEGLIKLIEPLMIVVLGSIIGTIILALYLPVFNLGSII